MDVREALQHGHLFRGAAEDDLAALADIAEPVFVANGEQVFDGARPADALIFIAMGTVDLINAAKDVGLITVGSGQMLGEVAFFKRGARQVSAVAREPTRAVCIRFDKLDALLEVRPSLALIFYRNLAREFAHHLGRLAADRDQRYL
jgi:CRP-like cAMP-binding protein